jgi:mobilome CxxCx(11)CxxC protein
MSTTEEQRKDCWDQAIYAFGTAYIFEKRLQSARKNLRVLTYLGVLVPVAVGGIVVSFFGVQSLRPFLTWLIVAAGILGTIQLAFTLWALVAKWDDVASYAAISSSENRRLAARFEELGKMPPVDFAVQYQLLKADNSRRQEADIQQGINDAEKRMITRAGLRQYQRTCVRCNLVPADMSSTNCTVCGNF